MIDPLVTPVSRSIAMSVLPLWAIVCLSKSEIAVGAFRFDIDARDYYHARQSPSNIRHVRSGHPRISIGAMGLLLAEPMKWRTALIDPAINEVEVEAQQPSQAYYARQFAAIGHAADRLDRKVQLDAGGFNVTKTTIHFDRLSHDSPPFRPAKCDRCSFTPESLRIQLG